MKKFKLFLYILIPLVIGGIVALIMQPFNNYQSLDLPPLSPPSIVFPIVWTILYILMGISAYLISEKGSNKDLTIYYIQLIVNALWTIIFFVLKWYLFAFLWLVLLIVLIILMIWKFKPISKLAAYLQIPYLLWCIFAAYLTLGIYILN